MEDTAAIPELKSLVCVGKEVPTRSQLFSCLELYGVLVVLVVLVVVVVVFLQLSCCCGEDVVGSKWLGASCCGLDCCLAHTACGGTVPHNGTNQNVQVTKFSES
jgi:hypothetical protein